MPSWHLWFLTPSAIHVRFLTYRAVSVFCWFKSLALWSFVMATIRTNTFTNVPRKESEDQTWGTPSRKRVGVCWSCSACWQEDKRLSVNFSTLPSLLPVNAENVQVPVASVMTWSTLPNNMPLFQSASRLPNLAIIGVSFSRNRFNYVISLYFFF